MRALAIVPALAALVVMAWPSMVDAVGWFFHAWNVYGGVGGA